VITTRKEALDAILSEMDKKATDTILGTTEIFLFPGYQFQLVNGLITNFHQPGSTLILLISSILGGDWKRVYEEALKKDYRFLSYGDSSLLWI
jgi:S-adenosylmethionine:tRNA ribosyltransferase-isomerase